MKPKSLKAWLLLGLSCLSVMAQAQAPARQAQGNVGHVHTEAPMAAASKAWTTTPLISQVVAGPERGAVSLAPQNLSASSLRIYPSDVPEKPWDVPVETRGAKVKPLNPVDGGAHWVSARQEAEGKITVASTVWFFASKGSSPERMLQTPKETLEILPLPATNRYREGESWNFLVRFDNQPWPMAPVLLETEQGGRQTLTTDEKGMVRVVFPRDIDPAKYPGVEEFTRVRSQFVLSTQRQVGDKQYVSAFNTAYMPDRMRERSLAWGAGFALLGMLLAVPLLRRKEKKNA